ncbi:hypothetical protein ACSBR1_016343 [Camellia fascicularis]
MAHEAEPVLDYGVTSGHIAFLGLDMHTRGANQVKNIAAEYLALLLSFVGNKNSCGIQLLQYFINWRSQIAIFMEARDRAPHGFAYKNPTAFSPSAFDFFHQNTDNDQPITRYSCAVTICSPLALATTVESALAYESKSTGSEMGGRRVGVGAIAGMVFRFVFVVILAMRVYYGVVTRQANLSRSYCVQLQPT